MNSISNYMGFTSLLLSVSAFMLHDTNDVGLKMSFMQTDGNRDGIISSAELRTTYSTYDLNGDSKISPAEYRLRVGPAFTLNAKQARALFRIADYDDNNFLSDLDYFKIYLDMDTNSDNQVTEQEYLDHTRRNLGRLPFVQLYLSADSDGNNEADFSSFRGVFRKMDTNYDGMVNAAELASAVGIGVSKAKELVSALDKNFNSMMDIEHEMMWILQIMDGDGSKSISFNEIISVADYLAP